MDQTAIAGIGNEYSDEILFRSGINPHRKITSCTRKGKETLYRNTKTVLQKAISLKPPRGTFDASWLIIHRKTDMQCPKNKNLRLKKETVAGRSAVYCPVDQK
jgi:formamidopyrimidine-DNA glycosylase